MLKFRNLMITHTVVVAVVGSIFIVWGPSLLSRYGPLQIPETAEPQVSLRVAAAFIRLCGAMLLGFGMLTRFTMNLVQVEAQRAIVRALAFAYFLIFFIACVQQIDIWKTPTGWLLVETFLALALSLTYLGLVKLGGWSPESSPTSRAKIEKMQEQWARQVSEAATQQERNRLARELHDSIKQQLFSINISAAAVQARWENDTAGARAALEDVRRGAHEAMAEMEAMLQHLRPVPLETVGLIEALRKQCEALQYRTGAQVITEFGELPANERLPLGAQEAIFRIAQESLANVARHARAHQVQVRLYTDRAEEILWLRIEDDGSGFDAVNATGGMGLTNIRTRVQEIGGRLHLESVPGAGTSLVVRVPLALTDGSEIKRLLQWGAACSVVSGWLIIFGKRVIVSLFTYQTSSKTFWLVFSHLAVIVLVGSVAAVAFWLRAHFKLREIEPSGTISKKNTLKWKRSLVQASLLLYGSLFAWADFWDDTGGNLSAMIFPAAMIIGYFLSLHNALREEDADLSREESREVSDQLWHQATKVLGLTLAALLPLALWQPTVPLLAMAVAIIAYAGFIAWWRRQVKARTLDALGGI